MLSALPTFALTVLKVPKKILAEVDKIKQRFLWAQDEEISGGKCKVSWPVVCTPIDNGGLGISNLHRFSRALRLRWLWFSWITPNRPWVGMQLPCDQGDKDLFNASTTVTLGDGKTASFWDSSWTGAGALKLKFPDLYKHSRRKNRTVHAAILNDNWIQDLAHGNTQHLWPEVIRLNRWLILRNMNLNEQLRDTIQWKHMASGSFSTSSAYKTQFNGTPTTHMKSTIWKAWAPAKIKIFSWLLHLDRLWCNDRLQRCGWPNSYFCQLCLRNLETAGHLFWSCPFAKTIWTSLSSLQHCQGLSIECEYTDSSSLEIMEAMVASDVASACKRDQVSNNARALESLAGAQQPRFQETRGDGARCHQGHKERFLSLATGRFQAHSEPLRGSAVRF